MAKIRFSLACNIIAAVCFAITGFGNLQKGDIAVGCLFLALLAAQIVMIVIWVRKIKAGNKKSA